MIKDTDLVIGNYYSDTQKFLPRLSTIFQLVEKTDTNLRFKLIKSLRDDEQQRYISDIDGLYPFLITDLSWGEVLEEVINNILETNEV